MMGHVFQILLTDEEVLAVLTTMRRHLKAGGKAVFETRNPRIDWAGVWGTHGPVEHILSDGRLRETLEITNVSAELISFQQQFEFPEVTLTTSSTLRFLSQKRSQLIGNSPYATQGNGAAPRPQESIFSGALGMRQSHQVTLAGGRVSDPDRRLERPQS